jgi:hypothetical protein
MESEERTEVVKTSCQRVSKRLESIRSLAWTFPAPESSTQSSNYFFISRQQRANNNHNQLHFRLFKKAAIRRWKFHEIKLWNGKIICSCRWWMRLRSEESSATNSHSIRCVLVQTRSWCHCDFNQFSFEGTQNDGRGRFCVFLSLDSHSQQLNYRSFIAISLLHQHTLGIRFEQVLSLPPQCDSIGS